jgi:HTH-type transcriptional regulator / antitoxin HigA
MTPPLPAVDLEKIARAWRKFETHLPVKLGAIQDEGHYGEIIELMNSLLDRIGDNESHPLVGLLHVVAALVREYEEDKIPIPTERRRSRSLRLHKN